MIKRKKGRPKAAKGAKQVRTMKRPMGRKLVTVKAKRSAMKKTRYTSLGPETLNEYIRTRAYYIWEELGKPQDQNTAIWKRAEKDIRRQLKKK